MNYKIIRSARKTLGITVSKQGEVLIRAPYGLSDEIIQNEIKKAEDWIKKAIERQNKRQNSIMNTEFDSQTVEALKSETQKIVIPLVEKYASMMKVKVNGVKITSARTRYGSCSGDNRLCFTFRLALFPIKAIEAVVVHELAHIKHKNHGKGFYDCIYKILPDYDERKKLLKK